MKLRDFIYAKAVTLCFFGIGVLLLGAVFWMGNAQLPLLLLTEGLLILLVAAWLVVSFWHEKKKLQKITKIIDQMEEKYLAAEVLLPPADPVQRQYFQIMRAVSRSAIDAVETAQRQRDEYRDYVESWIHEIKTPLTACSLILANGGDADKLRRELKRADNLTESILYYARARSLETDIKISKVSVQDVMDEAVKSQMELLIAAKISVETNGDFFVHTDKKALAFILKQLLINCAKYCPGAHVAITAQNGTITVTDNGPGIPAHELPRVTQRGFTGAGNKSTGMGLYIVSELCKKLEIDLHINSVFGQSTSVALSFLSLTKS